LFNQIAFSFSTAHSPQQLSHSSKPTVAFFHRHSSTKHTLTRSSWVNASWYRDNAIDQIMLFYRSFKWLGCSVNPVWLMYRTKFFLFYFCAHSISGQTCFCFFHHGNRGKVNPNILYICVKASPNIHHIIGIAGNGQSNMLYYRIMQPCFFQCDVCIQYDNCTTLMFYFVLSTKVQMESQKLIWD